MAGIRVRAVPVRRSKYGAKATTVDNIRFHSAAEARRYSELKLLEKAEAIAHLTLQPEYVLEAPTPCGVPVSLGRFIADFRYFDVQTMRYVVEDVKGVMTPLARWKIKHAEFQYGIDVQIVRRR